MKNKIILITGATSGIGKVAGIELAKKEYTLVLANRNPEKTAELIQKIITETGNKNIHGMELDLADLSSVRRCAEEFNNKFDRLDVLINNAGTFAMKRLETKDGFEMTIGTNHFGPFLLTNRLLPVLKKTTGARVINVSSNAHYYGKINLEDINMSKKFSGFPAYAASKLANVLFTMELSERLKDEDITVNALHPGDVATNIWAFDSWYMNIIGKIIKLFLTSPEKGAATTIFTASSENIKDTTGKYFYDTDKTKEPAEISNDIEFRKKFWELSEKLTGIIFKTE